MATQLFYVAECCRAYRAVAAGQVDQLFEGRVDAALPSRPERLALAVVKEKQLWLLQARSGFGEHLMVRVVCVKRPKGNALILMNCHGARG